MKGTVVSRFQTVFPPLFKENAGLGYSISILLHRLLTLLTAAVIFALALAICAWVIPSSITSFKDVSGAIGRLGAVCVVSWLMWKLVEISLEDQRARKIRADRGPVDEEAERKLLAEVMAGALAISVIAQPTGIQASSEPDDPEAMNRLIAELMRIQYPHPIKCGPLNEKERDELLDACIQPAKELQVVVRLAGCRLFAAKGNVTKINEGARSKIIRVLQSDVRVRWPKSPERPVSLVNLVRATRCAVKEEMGREETVDIASQWLESIGVGITDAHRMTLMELN